jgi:two-component system sensor histidine kinase CreC
MFLGLLLGVLTVGKPLRNVNALVAYAKRKVLLAGISIGIAVLALGLVISGMILRPIRTLTAYAQAVRDGHRVTLPPLGRSEIGTLGAAFEAMCDALEGKQYVEHYVQTLTHEIKSPLAAIQGAAALLQEAMPPEHRQRFVHNIQLEARRIHTLIEKLLLLAALENRKAIDAVEVVPLGAIVQEVQDSLLPLITAKDLRLELHGEVCASFQGEPFLVRQAVANLLHNAVEFTPRAGRITLTVHRDAAAVTMTVHDSGPGIPAYAAARVFERFYSLPRPDTGKKSSGLGLSLVREVAVLHGGTVTLTNAPGGGAVARLSFPLIPPDAPRHSVA